MTRFIDVPTMSRLVAEIGIPSFIGDLATYIGEDFARWHEFDKTARAAAHSPMGVIELMPVASADSSIYPETRVSFPIKIRCR